MNDARSPSRGHATTGQQLTARLAALPMSSWHYSMVLLCGLILIFDQADAALVSSAAIGITTEFGISQVELGTLISAAFIGATVSAALAGFAADRFGRKNVIAASVVIFALATVAAALAQSYTQLVVFRVIAGLGYGGLLPLAWAVGSELAPAASRGRTLSWLNAFFGGGTALAYLIGLAIIVPLGWRWGFAFFILPAFLAYFVIRSMPESIPYLIRRGRIDEAEALVDRIEDKVLRGRPRPEMAIIDANDDGGEVVSIVGAARQLFSAKHLLVTLSTIMAWPLPALFVVGLTSFYPVVFVREMGISQAEVLAFLTFSAFLTIVGRLLSGVFIDPVRRRSPSGLKIYLAVGVFFFAAVPFVILYTRWSPTSLLLLLCAQFLLQGLWGGAAMSYIPTVLPLAIRNAGLGLFSAITNVALILGPVVAGAILQFAGLRTASWITLAVAIVATLFVAVFGAREELAIVPTAQVEAIAAGAEPSARPQVGPAKTRTDTAASG